MCSVSEIVLRVWQRQTRERPLPGEKPHVCSTYMYVPVAVTMGILAQWQSYDSSHTIMK